MYMYVRTTDLIVDWIELSHLSKVKPILTCVLLLPGPQQREINMAVPLSMCGLIAVSPHATEDFRRRNY